MVHRGNAVRDSNSRVYMPCERINGRSPADGRIRIIPDRNGTYLQRIPSGLCSFSGPLRNSRRPVRARRVLSWIVWFWIIITIIQTFTGWGKFQFTAAIIASYIGWENALHVAAVLAVIGAFLWIGIKPGR